MGSFAANTAEIQPPVLQAVDVIGCWDFIFCENSRDAAGQQGAGSGEQCDWTSYPENS